MFSRWQIDSLHGVSGSQPFQGEWGGEGSIIFACNMHPEFANKCRPVNLPGFVPLRQELSVGPAANAF